MSTRPVNGNLSPTEREDPLHNRINATNAELQRIANLADQMMIEQQRQSEESLQLETRVKELTTLIEENDRRITSLLAEFEGNRLLLENAVREVRNNHTNQTERLGQIQDLADRIDQCQKAICCSITFVATSACTCIFFAMAALQRNPR